MVIYVTYIYTYSYVSVLLINIISSRHSPSSRKQQRHQCVFDALMDVGVDFSITYMDMIDVILWSDGKIFKLKTPLSLPHHFPKAKCCWSRQCSCETEVRRRRPGRGSFAAGTGWDLAVENRIARHPAHQAALLLDLANPQWTWLKWVVPYRWWSDTYRWWLFSHKS